MAKKVEIDEKEIDAPYALPEGWKWVRLGDIFNVLNGYAFKSDNYVSSGIRVIRITNVQDGYIEDLKPCFYPEEYNNEIKPYLLFENDLLISLTGNVGRIALLPKDYLPAALNQRVGCLRPLQNNVEKKFFAFYLRLPQFLNDCIKNSKGTAQLNMSTEWLKKYLVPLPPLNSQLSIVNSIESLFSKLDQAKEKAQSVVDSFETRKAAILHKAFTGQLKIDNEELTIENWEEKKLGEVCESIFDGDHMPPPKAESGIPFLVISNVNTGFLSFDNTRYVPNDYYDSLSETRKPKTGDVLYTIVGSYGIPVLVDSDRAFCFQRHMALLKPSKLISSRYLWYVLQSNEMYQKATSIATGTAQLTVPIKGLRELTIPVPPLNYQLSIVNFLDTVLEKESRAKEAAQTVLDQIALLKKSILARAFRGEL
ncbi:MAG: restriction endonuclease subunit S [Treponema sp.]|nr:restriction endonuclease subunit S [Treponema sp.]